jgi:dolichol-phosphate mannosyltransferase
MKTLSIVIPTYNEAGNVQELLTLLRDVSLEFPNMRVEVLLVDDSSPDGTADRAKVLQGELGTVNFSIDVEVRARKEGLGKAYIHGFGKVLDEDRADLILQMDADLSHNPMYIPQMLRLALGGADLVVASRYLPGGGTPDWGIHRKLLSRGGNLYIRLLLDRTLTDYTGAFCVFTKSLLREIDVATITASGYGFQIVLKNRAGKLARRIEEIPIVFMDRRHGESKIPKSTLVRNFVLVTKMRFGGSR